jgi:hypothetical protein
VGIIFLALSVVCMAPVVRTFLSLYTGDSVVEHVVVSTKGRIAFIIAATVFLVAGLSALLISIVKSMAAKNIGEEPHLSHYVANAPKVKAGVGHPHNPDGSDFREE